MLVCHLNFSIHKLEAIVMGTGVSVNFLNAVSYPLFDITDFIKVYNSGCRCVALSQAMSEVINRGCIISSQITLKKYNYSWIKICYL